jgi:hypothetical protein
VFPDTIDISHMGARCQYVGHGRFGSRTTSTLCAVPTMNDPPEFRSHSMHTTISRRSPVLARAAAVLAAAALMLVIGASAAVATSPNVGFAFSAPEVKGAPTGAVRLNGIGIFSTDKGFVRAGGLFRCTSSVGQGPLAGCMAGQGVRWSSTELLPSTPFKCTGAASEALKTATTDAHTAALRTEFFRAGDGRNASFTANTFVSASDLAPDIPGVQNVWVQGVGCGTATTRFSS